PLGPLTASQRLLSALGGSNANDLFDGEDEDLAVAELPRLRSLQDRVDRQIHHFIRQHDLNLDLRQEVDLVLTAAIRLRVPFLPAKAFHFTDRKADNTNLLQRVLYGIKQMRPDDALDLSHTPSFFTNRRKMDLALSNPAKL